MELYDPEKFLGRGDVFYALNEIPNEDTNLFRRYVVEKILYRGVRVREVPSLLNLFVDGKKSYDANRIYAFNLVESYDLNTLSQTLGGLEEAIQHIVTQERERINRQIEKKKEKIAAI